LNAGFNRQYSSLMPRPDIPREIERQVRMDARNRCGYCLSPQHLVMARLEIEHIIPLLKGGPNAISNLWLACPFCNGHKAAKTHATDPSTGVLVPLFNPRTQVWSEHFAWIDSGLLIQGTTPIGRATVVALQLSTDPDALTVRSYWILAGWHPPTD
jgi:HNH endonuclease